MQILISITELLMTLSIAVLTILYVIYTRKTLTAARGQARNTALPLIDAQVKEITSGPDESGRTDRRASLTVRNAGTAPAFLFSCSFALVINSPLDEKDQIAVPSCGRDIDLRKMLLPGEEEKILSGIWPGKIVACAADPGSELNKRPLSCGRRKDQARFLVDAEGNELDLFAADTAFLRADLYYRNQLGQIFKTSACFYFRLADSEKAASSIPLAKTIEVIAQDKHDFEDDRDEIDHISRHFKRVLSSVTQKPAGQRET